MTSQELKSYAKAGAVAEEVLSSIRTVFSYNGAAYELKRYEEHLRSAKLSGIRKGGLNGILMGIVWLLIFCVYALGFWYGAKLVRDEGFTIGGILIVFFSIITAVFSLGQAAPHLQSVAQARGAAYTLWNIIDTPSRININDPNGFKKEDLNGDIKFTNVHFAYPSRIDVPVLNGLSFTAQRGQTTALVGSSGCGKSTCIQLLQRFYDTIDGSVEIDDIQVNQYNLSWLREHIGVVSQEPILFHTTIKENILFGKTNATQDEIVTAAKMANAHDFIKELPDKYDTLVGERGAQLSGGQKQRIAIARALVRNPRILLLDEATSALDRESESIVQEALDRASKGRTTIVIAHRLSTIVNASKIIVLDKGSENFDGEIDLKDLEFYYPNRREVQVLKNFNLTIQPHKQIALVGSSGCGKSTIIQLLEHFYDPTGGQILINQNELSSLNLQWWRSQIGFVSQEPVLFNSTIRENIAYGDTSRIVSMEEIEQAAKNANIHHFITTLPKQYETNVGARGTQLSGGQKQRIAIARALIRNPKVLLLDEATSALDTENERIVQEALDEASKGRTTIVIAHRLSTIQNSDRICVVRRGHIVESGRTTIVIAHRLSTIQNSDRICVVRRGHIVESGKHDELLARKGYYYRLAQAKK
ncbi:unnamed protein product [Rotaria sordida]|uniref:Uncharacterized protein n=1 Tax=Rotaria sordida TaxID=392033 RepID=A0A813W2R6_9BILA|nr:unnamed protein product [Rotaria sordida]